MKAMYLLISLILVLGCNATNNSSSIETVSVEKNLTIAKGETVNPFISNFLSEGKTSISKQAKHFEISEMIFDQSGIKYKYKPIGNFAGTDYVEITQLSSIGDNNVSQMTLFKITIKVE